MGEEMIQSDRRNLPSFSALDPNLPLTAAKAGVQLESYLDGRSAEMGAVRDLADLLAKRFSSSGGGGSRRFFDPLSANVLSHAYIAFSRERQPTTTDELDAAVTKVTNAMHKTIEEPSRQVVEALRNFCVALSEHAALKRKALWAGTSNPYKRVFR
jgi:hypothetical protein